MKISHLIIFLSLTLSTIATKAESLVDGSLEAGKQRAITCTACHGAEGNSSIPMWPNIAGQGAPYTLSQLRAFKNASRNNPLMYAQAMMLSDTDMKDLAVYYESLPTAKQSVSDESLIELGEALYRGGKKETKVPACLACHGPSGRGNIAAKYPSLQGQHAQYTAKQLNDYASGVRVTDGKTRIMRNIAVKLSEEDITALSSYIQGLR
ncbi:MAG: cytochrome c4 [Gammaproteobacteria bacterium]|nr:cytochrome c4 [Gammaproteobacteria bacterium]